MTDDIKLLKEFKDVYLAKKQGEAIERASTPLNHDEAFVIDLHQKLIAQLTGYKGNELTMFTETVSRASGSIGNKRMEKVLEAVATIGQFFPMNKGQMPTPQAVDIND